MPTLSKKSAEYAFIPRTNRQKAAGIPRLNHVASGGQSDLFSLPDADWVIKVPRFSLLSVLALYARFPIRLARDRAVQTLGGLVLPYTFLRGLKFTSVKVRGIWDTAQALPGTQKLYLPQNALLTRRLMPTDILEEQLERGTPAKVADGLLCMLGLLEALGDRGFFLLDFVMKNFAWLDGQLVIADFDLIIPLSWVWHPHFFPLAYFFRQGLLKDYARIIRNALGRCGTADTETRLALEKLATDFPRRIAALPRRPLAADCDKLAQPVTFPAAVSREVHTLLARST